MIASRPIALVGVLAALTSCTDTPQSVETQTSARSVTLPVRGSAFDYQLTADYPPAREVFVVTRDWFGGTPQPGLYNICYINAFQTQPPDDLDRPDERDAWPADVVLNVEDPQWPGEFVIDLSTAARRDEASAHVATMVDTCAEKGFDAVEFDNLDSYSRFDNLPFGLDDTVAYATDLTRYAHERGLAVGQKNTVELTRQQSREDIGFDFAVVEQCAEFGECAHYRAVYDLDVFSIEYTVSGMKAACEQFGTGVPVLRRDINLLTPDDPGYQFETYCGFRGYG